MRMGIVGRKVDFKSPMNLNSRAFSLSEDSHGGAYNVYLLNGETNRPYHLLWFQSYVSVSYYSSIRVGWKNTDFCIQS